jgi:hypothetical protein
VLVSRFTTTRPRPSSSPGIEDEEEEDDDDEDENDARSQKEMPVSKKHKRKRRSNRLGSIVVPRENGEPKMSAVILKIAEPLLEKCMPHQKRMEAVILLATTIWNKEYLPAAEQFEIEKKLLDAAVGESGDAEDAAAMHEAITILEERRRKLFPKIRKLIVSYDLQFPRGQIKLDVRYTGLPDPDRGAAAPPSPRPVRQPR